MPSESNTYVFWMIAVYLLIASSIAFLTGDQVLEQHSLLALFSSYIAKLVPQINSLSTISVNPQVTKLFLSFAWFYCLCSAAIIFYHKVLTPIWHGRAITTRPVSKQQIFIIYAGMPFLLWMSIAWMSKTSFNISDLSYTAGRGKAMIAFASQSRFGLFMVGSIFPATVAAVFYSCATLLIIVVGNRILIHRRSSCTKENHDY